MNSDEMLDKSLFLEARVDQIPTGCHGASQDPE
jgi:hypothetical protein